MARLNEAGMLVDDDEEETELTEPFPKRARLEAARVYPRGTVKKVRVNNFMTYGDTVVIEPGPRLNLVLGPNGTGKSSLVCALCVGLGGSTKLLGRADSIKDYIKRGKTEAWTEITLSGGGSARDWVVRRHMKRTEDRYTSTWKINNVEKREKDVQELVASLNIQFDNLCQFLPQDKVVEFARMDPHELLVATEKAIGDASLHDKHEKLIQLCKEAKENSMSRDALEREVAKLEASNAKLERDYQRFRQREQLEARKVLLEGKLLWANVDEKQRQLREALEFHRLAKELLDKARQAADNESGPLKRINRQLDAAKAEVVRSSDAAKRCHSRRTALDHSVQAAEAAVEDARTQLQQLGQDSERRAAKMREAEEKLGDVQAALEALPPPVDASAEMAAITKEVQDIMEQERGIAEQQRELEQQNTARRQQMSHIDYRMRELNSTRFKILEQLAKTNNNYGAKEAANWVAQQKQANAFRGPVHGPVAVEVQLRDAKYANIVEMAISGSVGCFVVQHREDEQKLTQQFRQAGYRGSVLCYTRNPSAALHRPMGLSSQYAQYGIRHSLDEVMEAPPLVMHALNDVHWLTSNFIADALDDATLDRMYRETEIRNVYAGEHVYSNYKSKYNRTASTLETKQIKRSVVLIAGAGATQADQEAQQLGQQLRALDQQCAQTQVQLVAKESERDALRSRQKALDDRKQQLMNASREDRRKRQAFATKQNALQRELAAAQRQPDPLLQRPAKEAALKAAGAKHVRLLCDTAAAVCEEWGAIKAMGIADLAYKELDMQAKALSAASEARRKALQDKRNKVAQMEAAVKDCRARLAQADNNAKAQCPLTEELKAKFADPAMPNTREEIRAKIAEVVDEMEGINCNNPGVAEEYKRVQERIAELRGQVDDLTEGVDATNARIESIKSEWLPELQKIVGHINTTFAKNFAECCCAGEVLLAQSDDYAKWAINIMVKFREGEELQQLTANRQSGGERSVSTILYLIALQGVTVTPFRVVDEINQGMDPVNERKVFTQLVQASCREGTPQCFLLTPKLLPDLPFSPNITVLNIFNGPQIGHDVARAYSRAALLGKRYEALMKTQTQAVAC